jgi:hypothetical protein
VAGASVGIVSDGIGPTVAVFSGLVPAEGSALEVGAVEPHAATTNASNNEARRNGETVIDPTADAVVSADPHGRNGRTLTVH